jgi:hypothetical protein
MDFETTNSLETQPCTRMPIPGSGKGRASISTQFGETVDVRNRGALRISRLVGIQVSSVDAPAVVRIWTDDKCRELSTAEARALAVQLLEAARFAELQNTH